MVHAKQISFSYKKQEQLINGLSLELEKGKVYGLFGLNGAGKTTLLNIISGMLFPGGGECLLFGQQISKRQPSALQQVYVLPEQFELPNLTGEQYLKLHTPFYPDFDRCYFDDIVNRFEFSLNKSLRKLSFGQKKKFLIAFSMATNCSLLIMDEPTNSLDIPSKSTFRRIIASADSTDRTILISSHQVRDLNSIIDHILIMHNGKIIFKQSIDAVYNHLKFERINNLTGKEVLYSEPVMGAHNVIMPQDNGMEATKVDLELLFNSVIKQPDILNAQFKK